MSSGVWPAGLRWLRGLQGMAAWPHGRFPLIAAISCGPCPLWCGRRGGAGGVLDALAREPIMGWSGESRRRGGMRLWSPHLPLCGVAGPLAAVIPPQCPAWLAGSAWGGPGQVRARVNHILVCTAGAGELPTDRGWLEREDFLQVAVEVRWEPFRDREIAAIDFAAAAAAVQGVLPCSDGERQVLLVAAGIAEGILVDLREAALCMDAVNAARAARAICHAAGCRVQVVTETCR